MDIKRPLERILHELFIDYVVRVPDVGKIIQAMTERGLIKQGSDITNDHIAFRTLGVPNLGIQSLERIFIGLGYQKRDYYYFPEKKLDAFWYAPPQENLPRIFISELRVKELSESAQKIIGGYIENILKDPTTKLEVTNVDKTLSFLKGPLWELPTYQDYQTLANESEYAAWVICNQYYLNHYTMSVHAFPTPYDTLERFNIFLEDIGITLNNAGGKIKVSKDGLLKQSSSVAAMVEFEFLEGKMAKIPGSYVEFAERLPVFNPQSSGVSRREGFEADNADKIFESTYKNQIGN